MRKKFTQYDYNCMREAINLAKKGEGLTRTNPIVGAVIVRGKKIIARGYHSFFGGPHAEVSALKKAGKKGRGAKLYVTLEPCCSYGKTPPCTELIIAQGIKEVYIGSFDPNPRNARLGIRMLQEKGIKVYIGLLREETDALIIPFKTIIEKKRCYTVVKMAQTLDGKIATVIGDSKWISSVASREWVHDLRQRVDAVLVGKQTVLKDNPLLSVRYVHAKKQPARIIIDAHAQIPLRYNVFKSAHKQEVYVVVSDKTKKQILNKYTKKGINVITISLTRGRISLKKLCSKLLEYHIGTVCIEGGGEIVFSALKDKVVDYMYFFIAPKITGGKEAPTSVSGTGLPAMKDAISIQKMKTSIIGGDLLIEGVPFYQR